MVPRKPRNSVMWAAKDVTRVQMGRLMTYFLSPCQEVDNRAYILSYLRGEVRGSEILKVILNTTPDLVCGGVYVQRMYVLPQII